MPAPADRTLPVPSGVGDRTGDVSTLKAGIASAGKVAARPKRARPAQEPAAELPVARVCVDVPLPHLDRPFDYLVPAGSADTARPGVRVRVRFAGQLVDGFVLDRVERSEHTGRLTYLDRVVSPEPILDPAVARLCREIADRYAGTLPDVLRLAVPPRHARVESADPVDPPEFTGTVDTSGWGRYPSGAALLRALTAGRMPRAVWTALPGEDWPARLAEAAAACLAGGRGALLVVADARDLDRLDAALTALLGGSGHHTALSAAIGPAERYRRFLAASRGAARIVIGTRAAAFAPVTGLGLVAIWDDRSPARPTRTRARCFSPAPSSPAAARCSAGSPAAPRRSSSSRPRGRTRWSPTATWCAAPHRGSCPSVTTASSRATPAPRRRGCPASPGRRPARRCRRAHRC